MKQNKSDSQSEKEDQNEDKFIKLQEQFNDLKSNFESANNNLAESEKSVDKLHNDFNDISLQVKIVSLKLSNYLTFNFYLYLSWTGIIYFGFSIAYSYVSNHDRILSNTSYYNSYWCMSFPTTIIKTTVTLCYLYISE